MYALHHTPSTGGEEESHRANQVYALITHQLQVERRERKSQSSVCAHPHTSYRWRGEGESPIHLPEPIKWMWIVKEAMIDEGQGGGYLARTHRG